MNIDDCLEKIFSERVVFDAFGNKYDLDSNVDQAEGAFLLNLLRTYQAEKTIEIGCAYGISSLYICHGIDGSNRPKHTIIDPFQSTEWKGIGVNNLKLAEVNYFELIEERSELALPALLSKEAQFDFAFIDGWHTFDHTLVDFFYLNKMLKVGGVLAIDDTGMPAISKLLRYIYNYPCYSLLGGVPLVKTHARSVFEHTVVSPLHFLSKILPAKIRHEIFSDAIVSPDRNLGISCSMVAFKKISDDQRPWNWYVPF
jgi:predicted O-methyltransferase YrrM